MKRDNQVRYIVFNSRKCPPQHKDLIAFEYDLLNLMKSAKYVSREIEKEYNACQKIQGHLHLCRKKQITYMKLTSIATMCY